MKDFKLFVDLIRIKKPIGIMLLFWPCLWGLTLGNEFTINSLKYEIYLIYFLLGSFLMRSAGCVVNDILDRKYDKLVKRTKVRPIASGRISVRLGLVYAAILCLLAFFILIQFNYVVILLGIFSMPFAFSYPLMKRYTYWPQLFLGFTFNYGIIMGWFSINLEFSYIPIVFYIGAIFWTLGYDTIYGYQDIIDDEIIGVKSTSIKFKSKPKKFITLCYSITIISFVTAGILLKFNYVYFIFMTIPIAHMFYYQIKNLRIEDEIKCLKIFKSNNLLGLIIFLNILLGKITG